MWDGGIKVVFIYIVDCLSLLNIQRYLYNIPYVHFSSYMYFPLYIIFSFFYIGRGYDDVVMLGMEVLRGFYLFIGDIV